MTARNVHALAAVLRRLEREAAEGACALHPDRLAVGFIATIESPRGCCMACAQYGTEHGYSVHFGPSPEEYGRD